MTAARVTSRLVDGSDAGSGVSREAAAALDAADPLARFRARFVITDPSVIYLDGNSLGRLPVASAQRLRTTVDEEWGGQLVGAWSQWIDEPARVGDVLAEAVLGARPGEVLVGDSTTVNLFKLAAAAATDAHQRDPRRQVLVTTTANFPTDRFVLEGLARMLRMQLRLIDLPLVSGADHTLAAALTPDVALLCLSHVEYASGLRRDLAAVTALASEHGVRVLWDLSHSAGSVPLDLEGSGAELAVGCTYKYLNAGPGAPAYLYVRRELQPKLLSPIWGWFSQQDQFATDEPYSPSTGITRFAAGTPPILGLPLVEVGARLIAEAGIDTLAAKSAALTSLIVHLSDAWLTPLGFQLASPRDPAQRGGHVNLAHPDARRICRALIEDAKVVPDYRRQTGPDESGSTAGGTIRLGPAPLYTRHVDVWDAMSRLRELMLSGRHLRFSADPGRVT